MRFLIGLTCATLALLAFAACGDDETDGDDDPTTAAQGTPAPGETVSGDFTPVVTPQAINPDVLSTVSIDANADTDAIEPAAVYPLGQPFTVAFVIREAGGSYQGYQIDLDIPNDVLAYDSVEHLRPAGLQTCSPTQTFEGERFAAFCLHTELQPVTFTGPVTRITFVCETAGEGTLALRGLETANLGTKLQTEDPQNSYLHTLTMENATITCQ